MLMAIAVVMNTPVIAGMILGFEPVWEEGATLTSPTSGGSFRDPVTGMEFVAVKGGCFQMGDTFGDGDSDEKPVHEVCVSDFCMGAYEVTNAQYRKFKPDHDSGSFEGNSLNGDKQPVVNVSWEDATAYAEWLSRQSGRMCRLPTEAEWEYAARGGTSGRNYWGNGKVDACGYANVHDLTSKRAFPSFTWENHNCDDGNKVTAPVGSYKPNAFGVYDTMGNVWEWCSDWYGSDYYEKSPKQNPTGPATGSHRMARGGSWYLNPAYVRAASRGGITPGTRAYTLGFRLLAPVR